MGTMSKCGEVAFFDSGVYCRRMKIQARERRFGPRGAVGTEDILRRKVWLKGLSPMIWRRVDVAANTTLRELHGIIQVAMGWEGIHLFNFDVRATQYGPHELGARSPDVALGDLKIRAGARFVYKYVFNSPWEHEVRFEALSERKGQRRYPRCVNGSGACPPEDCGGPAGFLERRDAMYSNEGLDDPARMADFLKEGLIEARYELAKDADLMEEMRDLHTRLKLRESWRGTRPPQSPKTLVSPSPKARTFFPQPSAGSSRPRLRRGSRRAAVVRTAGVGSLPRAAIRSSTTRFSGMCRCRAPV